MNIGDMQQRDVAERVELEQVGFGQALLREDARERAIAGRERGRRSANLKNFPSARPAKSDQCRMPGTLSFRPSFCDAR